MLRDNLKQVEKPLRGMKNEKLKIKNGYAATSMG
jgi:hypothetical protein